MKVQCVTFFGVIQTIGAVGALAREELAILSGRISRRLLTIIMV